MKHDPVNHPKYYTSSASGIECIQVTEHMNFCLGNAMKYLWRADGKDAPIEDLKKAIWYIEREVARREKTVVAGVEYRYKNLPHPGEWTYDLPSPTNFGYGYNGVPYWWRPSWPDDVGYGLTCIARSCPNKGYLIPPNGCQ